MSHANANLWTFVMLNTYQILFVLYISVSIIFFDTHKPIEDMLGSHFDFFPAFVWPSLTKKKISCTIS